MANFLSNWWNTPVTSVTKKKSNSFVPQAQASFTPTPVPTPPAPKPTTQSSPNYTPAPLNYTPANYSPVGGYAFNQPPATTPSPASTGGTSGGGGQVNQPTQQSSGQQQGQQDYSGFQQQVPEQPQIDFDALIAPAIQGLEAAIAPLQQGLADTTTGIQAGLTTQKAANQANITGQENVLNQARTSQTEQAENAVNEARRQYAEIQQGLQSRYGGTTGTGAFAGELAGRQTQQNIGKYRQQLSSAMLEIDNKLQQVQEVGRISLQDLEDKAADQVRQAKNNLDLQLADIRRQKGEIQANKAALAANAIQIYQTTVNNVNAQNAQFKQNLALQQQAAEQNLKLAQGKAQGIAQSFTGSDYNIGRQVTPVGNVVTQYPAQGTADVGGQLYDTLKKRFNQLGTNNSQPVFEGF